jgi:hypothetical protein
VFTAAGVVPSAPVPVAVFGFPALEFNFFSSSGVSIPKSFFTLGSVTCCVYACLSGEFGLLNAAVSSDVAPLSGVRVD